jgi:hypothetical protein
MSRPEGYLLDNHHFQQAQNGLLCVRACDSKLGAQSTHYIYFAARNSVKNNRAVLKCGDGANLAQTAHSILANVRGRRYSLKGCVRKNGVRLHCVRQFAFLDAKRTNRPHTHSGKLKALILVLLQLESVSI